MRLDNVVLRLGLATTRAQLRLALPVGGPALDWVRRETATLRARIA